MFMARSFRVGFASSGRLAIPTRLDGASSVSIVRFDPFPLWKREQHMERFAGEEEEGSGEILEEYMSENLVSILARQLAHSFVDSTEREYELPESERVPPGVWRTSSVPFWQLEPVNTKVSWRPYAQLLDYLEAVIETLDGDDGRTPPQTVDSVFTSALQLCMSLFGQELQWRQMLIKDAHFPEKRVFQRTRLPIPHMDAMGGEQDDDYNEGGERDDFGLKESLVQRRFENLSRWLLEVIPENKAQNKQDVASRLFSSLANHEVQAAIDLAVEHRFFRLASILTQMIPSPDASVQGALRSQLAYWEDTGENEEELEGLLSTSLLDVYRFISGAFEDIPHSSPSSFWQKLSLHWITHFSLYVWYQKSLDAPFADTLTSFEAAVRDQRVLEPRPHYSLSGLHLTERKAHGRSPSIFYQLIRFAFGTDLSSDEASFLLSRLLSGEGVTADPLDSRASWVLLTFFSTLYGVDHINPTTHFSILSSFSLQLCNLGLWEWSVFLSLCSPSEYVREHFAKELIFRFAPVFADGREDEQKLEDKERKRRFLVEELKVPDYWLLEADAIYQEHQGHYLSATDLCQQAGMTEDYWRIVESVVAPEFFLAGQFQELEEAILGGLEGPTTTLSTLFALFLDAKQTREEIQELESQDMLHPEALKTALTHLRSLTFSFLNTAVLWHEHRLPLSRLPPSERKGAIKARLCVGSMTFTMLDLWNFAMDTLLPLLEEGQVEQDLIDCEEEWAQMEALRPSLPLLQTDILRMQPPTTQSKGFGEQEVDYESEDEDLSFGF
jgi:hypothetical protein